MNKTYGYEIKKNYSASLSKKLLIDNVRWLEHASDPGLVLLPLESWLITSWRSPQNWDRSEENADTRSTSTDRLSQLPAPPREIVYLIGGLKQLRLVHQVSDNSTSLSISDRGIVSQLREINHQWRMVELHSLDPFRRSSYEDRTW